MTTLRPTERQYRKVGRTREAALALALALGLSTLLLVGSAGLARGQDETRTVLLTGVSVADIRSVMEQHRLDVRECVAGDALPGRVDIVVDFVIDADGTVQTTRIVESNAGQTVDACVLGVFGAMVFPAPTDGRAFAVRYPMIFVTGNRPAADTSITSSAR